MSPEPAAPGPEWDATGPNAGPSQASTDRRAGLDLPLSEPAVPDLHSHRPIARWLHQVARAIGRLLSAHRVFFITVAVGGIIFVALTAVAASVYESIGEGDGVAGLDRPVLEAVIALRNPVSDQIGTWFTDLGGPIGMSIIAACITGFLTWRWHSRTPLILMLIAVAGSLSMTTIGKIVVNRARPPLADAVPPYEHSPSFPSGHTLNSTVIAGMVAYLVFRRLAHLLVRILTITVAVLWAAAMGASRVFLGHHWLSDVVAAWLLGLAWLSLIITVHRLAVRRGPQPEAIESPKAIESNVRNED